VGFRAVKKKKKKGPAKKTVKHKKKTVLNCPTSMPSAIAEPLAADVKSVYIAPADTHAI
jgi:hypothetical protein